MFIRHSYSTTLFFKNIPSKGICFSLCLLKSRTLLACFRLGDSSHLRCVFSEHQPSRYWSAQWTTCQDAWALEGSNRSQQQKCIWGGWVSLESGQQLKSQLKAWNLKWSVHLWKIRKEMGEKYNKEGRNSLCLLSIHHIYAFYSGEWCLFPLMGTSSVREFSKGNLKALVVN